jgi:hypothetical protein
MTASIYIPNELEIIVQNYLKDHPEMSLSGLVQEAPENKLKPRRNTLLELAGFVSFDGVDKRTPEQIAEDLRERPQVKPLQRPSRPEPLEHRCRRALS